MSSIELIRSAVLVMMMGTVSGMPAGETVALAPGDNATVHKMTGTPENNAMTCWYLMVVDNTCYTQTPCVKPRGAKNTWVPDKRGMKGCEITNNEPCGAYEPTKDTEICKCFSHDECPDGAPHCVCDLGFRTSCEATD